MDSKVGFIFISIFAIVIMFLVPAYQTSVKQDDLAHQFIEDKTYQFVDSIRTKGYIDAKMLDEFHQSINIGSYIFDVELVHEQKFYQPIYANVNDPLSFTGEYDVHFEEFYTEAINKIVYDQKQKYKMNAEDFIAIKVKNKGETPATTLRNALLGLVYDDSPAIMVSYGGKVLNENY